MFQSSRAASPQDASRAPYFVSLLSTSARSYLDAYKQRTLRPVSEVVDMEIGLGPACRYVDPVFHHSWHQYVGFVWDLVKAGPTGFVEDAVEHVGLFFCCQEGGWSEILYVFSCNHPTLVEASIWTAGHR